MSGKRHDYHFAKGLEVSADWVKTYLPFAYKECAERLERSRSRERHRNIDEATFTIMPWSMQAAGRHFKVQFKVRAKLNNWLAYALPLSLQFDIDLTNRSISLP